MRRLDIRVMLGVAVALGILMTPGSAAFSGETEGVEPGEVSIVGTWHLMPCSADTYCGPDEASSTTICWCDLSGRVVLIELMEPNVEIPTAILLTERSAVFDADVVFTGAAEQLFIPGLVEDELVAYYEASPLSIHECDTLRYIMADACFCRDDSRLVRFYFYDADRQLIMLADDYCADGFTDELRHYVYDEAGNQSAVEIDLCADGTVERICDYELSERAPYITRAVRCRLVGIPPVF